MQNLISEADRHVLKSLFIARRGEYYQALSVLDLPASHYDVLRGRIAELNELLDKLELN